MSGPVEILKKAFRAAQRPYLTWRMLDECEVKAMDNARMLIERGADLHAEDDIALAQGAWAGDSDFIRFLLDRGADVNAAGGRALRTAALHGHLKIVRMLHEAGGDIHAGNGEALIAAAENGYMDIVTYLVENGVRPDGPDHPAIHDSRLRGHERVARYLEDNIDPDPEFEPVSKRVLWSSSRSAYRRRRPPKRPDPTG